MDRNLVLIRRCGQVVGFNMLVIRSVLSLFIFVAFVSSDSRLNCWFVLSQQNYFSVPITTRAAGILLTWAWILRSLSGSFLLLKKRRSWRQSSRDRGCLLSGIGALHRRNEPDPAASVCPSEENLI